jgi:plastocyanin
LRRPPKGRGLHIAKLIALVCSCLALGFVAVACGGDDEESGGGGGGGGGSAGGGGGKAVAVLMRNIQFHPASVTVSKGGSVKWTNEESLGHDVTKTGGPGPEFKSGDPGAMQQGDTFEQKFDSPGKIEYVCTVHANMKGTITVR